MTTHAVSGTFSGSGTLAETGSGIKKRKSVGGAPGGELAIFEGSGSLDLDTTMMSFKRNISHVFSGGVGSLDLDMNLVTIVRSQVWWNKNYTYRRVLQVQPNEEGFEIDHPFIAYMGRDTIRQNKVRSDGADIEVLRLVSFVPEVWELVPKRVLVTDEIITVEWPNQVEIAPETTLETLYYIYYGNQDLVAQPDQVAYEPIEWPVVLLYDDPRITYTRPGEHWNADVSAQADAKATLRFYGSDIRIMSDVGPEWGQAIVQVDDGEWEIADLYDPVAQESQEVYTKTDLSPMTSHYIRFKRSGFKAAPSTGFEVNLQAIEYLRHNTVPNIMEEADETLMWGSAIGGVVGK